MKYVAKILLAAVAIGSLCAVAGFRQQEPSTNYKCMVQMVNYTGEKAYVIVSLMNPKGEYDQTLHILGDDSEWFHLIDEWWSYFGKKKRDIDGITGPTIGGGARKVIAFDVENAKLDQGYKIRFETSVEDQQYHPADLEIEASYLLPTKPVKGSGYIRYVRIMPQ